MNLFTSQNMVRVVIYAVSEQDARALEPMLRQAIQSRRQWPLIQSFPGDFSGFLRYVEGNPYLIMLAAVPGPSGARLVRQIRAVNPDVRLIWLSDRENALGAFGAHVTAFGQLPADGDMLEQALDACNVRRRAAGSQG